MSNIQLEEMQEEYSNKQLASYIGITFEDLCELEWDIDTNESNDGLIYEYIIEFQEGCSEEILDKIEELEDGRIIRLPPWVFADDSYENEIEWDIVSSEQLKVIESHLESVNNLLSFELDDQTQFNLLVMLHAHIVAAMESFLSSMFIHVVTNSETLTRKLIETTPEFGRRKFTLKDIYHEHKNLKITVAKYLKSLIFHKIKNVKPMYKNVMNFDFGDISWLLDAINCRHDCTHRAGYNMDGVKIDISIASIKELMQKCKALSSAIDSHIIKNKL